jgi:hypothetical protein
MSLAKFMGGTASGPRLNKHAPQLDATDPSLFVPQRNMKELPGSGNPAGIALPGLVTSRRSAQSKQADPPAGIQASWVASSAPSTPPFASSTTPQPSSKTSTPDPHRPRSSTGSNTPYNSTVPVSAVGRSVSPHNPLATKLEPERVLTLVQDSLPGPTPVGTFASPKTSVASRWPPTGTIDTTLPPKPASPQPLSASTSLSSSISPPPPPPPSHNLMSSPNVSGSTSPPAPSPQIASLARPIQPSSVAPQTFLPPTSKPSPAFQKPGPPKEERPSITRLKGRGFVERRVQASAHLSNLAKATEPLGRRSSSSGPPEKKLSVLNRWPEVRDGPDNPIKPTLRDSPLLKSSPKPQWPSVSTPPAAARLSPSPSPSPGSISMRSASPSTPEVKKERNPEHDATPLRLPGMASARSLPTKAQSQPTHKVNSFAPAPSNPTAASPVRLPGLATTSLSGVIERPSPPNSLKTPGRRRSVHFEDGVEILKSQVEYDTDRDDWRGTMTDPGGPSRLTHVRKNSKALSDLFGS